MNKIAALACGVALSLTAAVPAASAQASTAAILAAQRNAQDELRGGPRDDDNRGGYRDDRADPRFHNGGWARPDAVGRTSAYFIEPRLNGQRVMVDYRRANARFAEETATDNFCRRVGYREGAYYSIERGRGGAALSDVLCIR